MLSKVMLIPWLLNEVNVPINYYFLGLNAVPLCRIQAGRNPVAAGAVQAWQGKVLPSWVSVGREEKLKHREVKRLAQGYPVCPAL